MDEKSKRVREVIYQEINECQEYVTDIFWKRLFDDMSRGKCPKGIVIFKTTVNSTYKRNGFSYCFEDTPPEKIASDLMEILKTSGCIYSSSDIKKEEKEFETSNTSRASYSSWKQIKIKKIRQQYIHDFVLKQTNKCKLSDHSSKQLMNLINSSLNIYKTHRSDDVLFENNEIVKIEDIEYDESLKEFINLRDVEDKEDVKKEVNILKKKWENYILRLYRDEKSYLK
jgi:hypothetical protein